MCLRVHCSFSHLPAAGTASSAFVQQPQLQAVPAPPPPPPPPPPLRHQTPQYQAAAIVGVGLQEEGPESLGRRASHELAETTRPAVRAGLQPEAERVGGPASTDSTGSAIWQSRPKGGQGRGKNGQSSHTPGGAWEFSTRPPPGRCHWPCFTVRVWYRETTAVNNAADRLRQRPGKRPYG